MNVNRISMPLNIPLIFNILIAIGGWMLAVWTRLFMPVGDTPASDYTAWPWWITFILIGGVLLAYGVAYLTLRLQRFGEQLAPRRQFRVLLLALPLMCAAILLFAPDVEPLQVAYFPLWVIFIAMLTVVLPGRLRRNAYAQISIWGNLLELYHKRELLLVWLKYRIENRYAQTFLGILWIILLPLSTAGVLAFAFGVLLGAGQLASGVSWVNFLLSGIAVFGIFRELVLKAKGSIVGASSIIGRVYFPREIIIILVLGETLVDFLFIFVALVVINATQGIYPNWHYIFLPIPILIVTALSTGLAFIIAWLSLIMRDLQQLLTVIMQLLFYVVVLYSPERVDADFALAINALPLTPIVNAVRDIVLFNRTPDFVSLYYPFVLAVCLLYFGYVYFKVNEDRFLDFV